MNLLLDQDVWEATAQFLADRGHDVLRVAEIGLATADDEELLRVAQERNRIFITRDSDFGGLVFVRKLGAGVIYCASCPRLSGRFTKSWRISCKSTQPTNSPAPSSS